MNKAIINKIFSIFHHNNPNPSTELHYKNNFELLIAVMLSAQATDISVNKATPALFKAAPTPQAMVDLGESNLKNYIKTIGLYNTKASNVIKTCKKLISDFKSKVPKTREELESLSGVGRKTANVVLNTAFGEHTIAVDTHIFRVSKRIGLADGNTPLSVELQLEKVIPEKFKKDAHHWLILHGRYVCKARAPLCANCCIRQYCEYPFKTS